MSKKKYAAISLCLLFLVSSAFAQNWFKGTLDEAVAKARTENKKVLLDFFSGG